MYKIRFINPPIKISIVKRTTFKKVTPLTFNTCRFYFTAASFEKRITFPLKKKAVIKEVLPLTEEEKITIPEPYRELLKLNTHEKMINHHLLKVMSFDRYNTPFALIHGSFTHNIRPFLNNKSINIISMGLRDLNNKCCEHFFLEYQQFRLIEKKYITSTNHTNHTYFDAFPEIKDYFEKRINEKLAPYLLLTDPKYNREFSIFGEKKALIVYTPRETALVPYKKPWKKDDFDPIQTKITPESMQEIISMKKDHDIDF